VATLHSEIEADGAPAAPAVPVPKAKDFDECVSMLRKKYKLEELDAKMTSVTILFKTKADTVKEGWKYADSKHISEAKQILSEASRLI